MMYPPETLNRTAAQVLQLFHDATAALADPIILEAVTRCALAHPEIEWEPVALAACALNEKRYRDKVRGATSEPLAVKVNLPHAGLASADVLSFPLPPRGI